MVKITADSTCDLSPELLAKWDITLAPLYALVNGESYRDGVDIAPEDVFRHVESGRRVLTAAVNQYDYEQLFAQYARDCDAVIHIAIGAQFSACYENACLAATLFKNVHVVDSRNLSSGSGHVVLDAAGMAGAGLGAEEIVKALTEIIPRVDASFVVERLDYLRRGGRCSGLEAVGARILSIKPCIEVIQGEMRVGKRYRGSFDRCLEHYAFDRLAEQEGIDFSRVFVTHSPCAPETVRAALRQVGRLAPFREIIETRAGCTVSSHCGPGTLGILFKRTRPKTAVEAR